jgi:hypothetical protein
METQSRREFLQKTGRGLIAVLAGILPVESALAKEPRRTHSNHVSTRRGHSDREAPGSSDYSFLNAYDGVIDNSIKYFGERLGQRPPRNLIKAMIAVETGSGAERYNGFVHDPMQIASDGDALGILASGRESTRLIGDFTCLRGKRRAVRRGATWNYSGTGMNGQAGVYGGVGWLLYKQAIIKKGRIVGWHSLDRAVMEYNGSRAYMNKVLKIKRQLDARA